MLGVELQETTGISLNVAVESKKPPTVIVGNITMEERMKSNKNDSRRIGQGVRFERIRRIRRLLDI